MNAWVEYFHNRFSVPIVVTEVIPPRYGCETAGSQSPFSKRDHTGFNNGFSSTFYCSACNAVRAFSACSGSKAGFIFKAFCK